MKRWSPAVGLAFLAGLVWTACGNSGETKDKADPEKGVEIKIADVEDYVAKTKALTVNNLSIKETPNEDVKGFVNFEFKASVKNRSDANVNYILMVAGLNADKKIVWTLAPRTGLNANDQHVIEEQVIVPEGAKKATQYLWLRVVNR
ncbi:MAG: hypothetical protein U0793_19890 [Gemmataceae bacterium]